MNLVILNTPKHLSPSAFKEWSLCQMKFFLKRMAGHPYPEFYQSLAAACGSAFDAYVKHEIAKHLGLGDDPRFNLQTLLEKAVDVQNRAEAFPIGKQLLDAYISNGCLEVLKGEGIASVELSDRKDLVLGDDTVPILALPDAALMDGTVIEFKVQGAVSKSGASPNPGYIRSTSRGLDKPAHPRHKEPLEMLNHEWADQLIVYSWIQSGILPWRTLPVAVENITVRNGIVTCSSIRTHISIEYQQKLWERYVAAWQAITSGDIGSAAPHPSRCFDYNTCCEVSHHCTAFSDWQKRKESGDPLSILKS